MFISCLYYTKAALFKVENPARCRFSLTLFKPNTLFKHSTDSHNLLKNKIDAYQFASFTLR